MIDDRVSLFDTHFSNSPFLYELKVHWKKKKSSVRVFESRCKLKHTTIWQNRDYEIWLLSVLNNNKKIWSFHHSEFDTDDSKYIFKGENSLTLEFLVTCGYYLGTLFKGYLWFNYKLMCDTVKIWKFSLDFLNFPYIDAFPLWNRNWIMNKIIVEKITSGHFLLMYCNHTKNAAKSMILKICYYVQWFRNYGDHTSGNWYLE